MKVLIITEGGKGIGFGHIARCLSLSQALKKKGIIAEFVINGSIKNKDLAAVKWHRIFNWLEEKERLFKMAEKSDIAIIDSYLATSDIYDKISQLAKRCVYIDDNNRLRYPKGIVVNGTVFAELMKYPKSSGVEYLLGSRYTPLRKEFWTVPEKRINSKIKSIMITFGGTDGKNITPKVMDFLNAWYPSVVKNVIVGAAFKNISEIERFKDKKVNLIYKPDAGKMRSVMLKSDIAISAAGQTLYELARVGVPTIAVCVSDNQLRSVRNWQKSGFIKYAGTHSDKALFGKLSAGIIELVPSQNRRKVSAIGRNLVDGNGAERIVKRSAWKR